MLSPVVDVIRSLKSRIANNPDYGWSVASGYAHMGLNIVVQIALVPMYLDHLGKEQFGILMIMLAAVNYLGMGVAWISSGAQRVMGEHAARDEHDQLEHAFGLTRLLFFAYSVLSAGAVVVAVWLLQERIFPAQPELAHDIFLMVIIGAGYVVILYDLNVDRLALIAIGRQAWANVLNVLTLAVFAALAVPLLLSGYGLTGVMSAFLGGAVLARAVSFWITRRCHVRPRRPGGQSRAVVRRLIGPMGIGYGVYGVLLLTLLQADTLILGAFGGAALVADFVLVWKIADVAMQALWRLPDTMVPYLIRMDARGEHDRMQVIFTSARKWMAVLAALGGGLFALFGQHIVEFWVGAEHAPDLPWAYALAGGGLFWMSVARLPAVYAFATVRLKPLIGVTALETLAKLAIMGALIAHVGLYAPLIAINVVHIAGVAYLYQKLARGTFSKGRAQEQT